MTIDRHAVVNRHHAVLDAPDAGVVLSVGNGDFGFTADVTGLQTFTPFHEPVPDTAPGPGTPRVTGTSTMTSWGWDEQPNDAGYVLADATTEYRTRRGGVRYPDRPPLAALMSPATEHRDLAGRWLIDNPHRIDLGRLGLILRPRPDAEPETTPWAVTDVRARLDPWTGVVTSTFSYLGQPVEVVTVAHAGRATVATRVSSPLLSTGQVGVTLRFGAGSTHFVLPVDWDAPDRHTSEWEESEAGAAVVRRRLATSEYTVAVRWNEGTWTQTAAHRFELGADTDTVEVLVDFEPVSGPGSDLVAFAGPPAETFAEVEASSVAGWERFWRSGAAVDVSSSTHPLAGELERRIVWSQYLTRVHGAGVTPPQETGFVTNSWLGKFHLEMHWWHAAHFAAWGRPELLERSLSWYERVHETARATAGTQGYDGARWPKQVGPDGRESPSDIGSLLIWQQPHLLYFAELLWRAHRDAPAKQNALAHRLGPLLDDTAAFMADFADDVDGSFHLGPPVMPAQEFYAAAETADPTFELAYWSFALGVAQTFRRRRGLEPVPAWEDVLTRLTRPSVTDGHYAAVEGEETTRADDHPSMALALGFVPATAMIDEAVMRDTLHWIRKNWDWDSAWGWDFPALAMTAARLGEPESALDLLLHDGAKNQYDDAGHNPQMGSFLPVYLPGNGGLLSAVSLILAGTDSPGSGFGAGGGWQIEHEGLIAWP
ncbi:hypothetical protein ABZX85_28130 [Streptomyces sp. NPDC004539]|uniref:hypothetical protein n=1 Tax=Streptomyces sp. NPDC004539 TaxID=3154280 RepID=UPI0033B990FA